MRIDFNENDEHYAKLQDLKKLLTYDDLWEMLGVSRVYLQKIMSKEMNITRNIKNSIDNIHWKTIKRKSWEFEFVKTIYNLTR